MKIDGGINIGNGVTISSELGSLYTFSTFTFTNGNTIGNAGPTVSNLRANYDTVTYSWLNNNSYFTASQGIQQWTVPQTGTYQFEVAGAAGGNISQGTGVYTQTGYGAKVVANIALTQGSVVKILVGQRGSPFAGAPASSTYNSGGGGGSFVFYNLTDAAPLIAAGGGGGGVASAGNTTVFANAGITANGIPGIGLASNASVVSFSGLINGATLGYGGVNKGASPYYAGMGGGWKGDGGGGHTLCVSSGPYRVTGGLGGANATPFIGGDGSNSQSTAGPYYNYHAEQGGFGGGGGGTGRCGQSASGAGGGYTGGSQQATTNSSPYYDTGQGGGSYVDTGNATVVSLSTMNTYGNGYVKVTYLGS
jgi:Glycine rich protein